jgi:hypothetical protein
VERLFMAKNKKKELKIHSDSLYREETLEELQEKLEREYKKNELDSLYSMRNRARSIAAGTAFGGVVEVTMRSESNYMYAQMQPTEAVELIEQLAAGIGVEVAMRPKVNFASWRGWEEVIEQRIGWDRIGWKGTAAWQLGGRLLEENHQKKLASVQDEIEKQEILPAPTLEEIDDLKKKEEEKKELSDTPKATKTRKTRKTKNENEE